MKRFLKNLIKDVRSIVVTLVATGFMLFGALTLGLCIKEAVK